ncbi:alpha/beta fold hydrolase [Catenulispora yoronensis]|uniref:Alpha/beta fold hydrolase n=1 Tax=Catenulispora yoronensis TaxID=450799 RepID=A0ABN2UH22_9ACTN
MALAPGGPADQTISGTLCRPTSQPSASTVDVLVHGAGYNQSYWDWPVGGGSYSYVARTLAAGRATFAYDRLGVGASSHPLSALVTTAADACALHKVIGLMRGSGFSTVDVVGHSFGSVVAIEEAATYQDVDKLAVTGLLHSQGLGLATVAASFYPADIDPQFGLLFADPGYLTTLPGTRGSSFYNTATADPAVIAYDEAHKDAISGTELAAGIVETELPALTNPSRLITAPVLVLDGQQDGIFCGLTVDCTNLSWLLGEEAQFYSGAARLSVATVAGTGHDVALHPSAAQSFAVIDQWITSG